VSTHPSKHPSEHWAASHTTATTSLLRIVLLSLLLLLLLLLLPGGKPVSPSPSPAIPQPPTEIVWVNRTGAELNYCNVTCQDYGTKRLGQSGWQAVHPPKNLTSTQQGQFGRLCRRLKDGVMFVGELAGSSVGLQDKPSQENSCCTTVHMCCAARCSNEGSSSCLPRGRLHVSDWCQPCT
jgi:hypothetical protein